MGSNPTVVRDLQMEIAVSHVDLDMGIPSFAV
jgi:hypothetical protein